MSINSETFHFKDFTLDNYRNLIQIAKEHYRFVSYTSFDADVNDVIWRHDVDFSMHAAKKLAIIEHEEGIKATYFLLLHSDFYNLLEPATFNLVMEIISLGHYVGLHFYARFYNVTNEEELIKYLTLEKTLLENIFEYRIESFSFHNPEPFELSCKGSQYAGLINTYASSFQEKTGYCSDSNGYWRNKRLENFLHEYQGKSIQVLTHPEWWTEKVMSPKEKIMLCINDQAKKLYTDYETLLLTHGRQIIDW